MARFMKGGRSFEEHGAAEIISGGAEGRVMGGIL